MLVNFLWWSGSKGFKAVLWIYLYGGWHFITQTEYLVWTEFKILDLPRFMEALEMKSYLLEESLLPTFSPSHSHKGDLPQSGEGNHDLKGLQFLRVGGTIEASRGEEHCRITSKKKSKDGRIGEEEGFWTARFTHSSTTPHPHLHPLASDTTSTIHLVTPTHYHLLSRYNQPPLHVLSGSTISTL